MTTTPFGAAGYRVAYGLAVETGDIYITTNTTALTQGVQWWIADDAITNVMATFIPGYLVVGEVSSSDPGISVELASTSSTLASAIANGTIIGTQAHLILWAWDASGTLQYTRDWHLVIGRAAIKGQVVTMELYRFRPWLTGAAGVYGLSMLQACPWVYSSPPCGYPGGSEGCIKTTAACKSKPINILASDDAASVETSSSAFEPYTSGSTVSRSTAAARHGQAALLVQVTSSALGGCRHAAPGRAAVSPSKEYCLSCYVLAKNGAPTLRLRIAWYDGAGALIGTSSTYSDIVPSSTWQRVSVRATAPADAARAGIQLVTTVMVTASWYVDCVMIEEYWPTLRPAPSPWVLPSWGNLIRYGGLITAPKAGAVVRYYAPRGQKVTYVERVTEPPLPPPPQPEQPRTPRRVIKPGPPPPPPPPQRRIKLPVQPPHEDIL